MATVHKMQDYAKPDRQVMIESLQPELPSASLNEIKRMRALAWLGPKWVLHKSNAVKRRVAK